PQTRLFLWERTRDLHRRGVTIVLTTHDMEEADRLCDRIAIMDHGQLLALDTPDGLKRLVPGGTVAELRLRAPDPVLAGHAAGERRSHDADQRFRQALGRVPGITRVEPLDDQPLADGTPATLGYRLYASEEAGALLAGAAQTVIAEQAELLDLRFALPS